MLQALIETEHPQLRGSVVVTYKPRSTFLYAARKAQGNRIRVIITSTCLSHPDKRSILHRAAMSALEIRRGITDATRVFEGELIDE